MANDLTVDLGKKLLVEPSGPRLTDEEKQVLRELKPGAIMFRKRNFLIDAAYPTWLEAYRKLVQECREAVERDNLILSVDHEGGRVIRFPPPVTAFPYASRWGESVPAVAEAMAIELKSLAINVNFAPVADIHSNPNNPVIADRAFAREPEAVARAAVQFAEGMKNNGICPCAKHFPGHGDTSVDSHFGLPVVDLAFEELHKRELVPFKALVDWGVPMVMTAHIVFPKVDPDECATLSKPILKGILREDMGFQGVVIADALGMAAVKGNIDARQTIVKAVNAGLDIFLAAGDNMDLSHAQNIKRLMIEALQQKEITEQTLHASLDRIDRLQNTLPQYEVMSLPESTLDLHRALADELSARAPWSGFELNLPGFE